jgi:hypothetical protein
MRGTIPLGNRVHAFWMPPRHAFMKEINAMLKERADRFIRTFYRRISETNRISYWSEYHFRLNHGHNPRKALSRLLRAGTAAVPPA